jgi:hypothetical protein
MLADCRNTMPKTPPANRIKIGLSPTKNTTRDNAPSTPSPASLTAVFPKRQMAMVITATTAGLIPVRTDIACGNDPKRT